MKIYLVRLSFDNNKSYQSFFVTADDFIEATVQVHDLTKKSNMQEKYFGNITEVQNVIPLSTTGPSVHISNQFLFTTPEK